MRVQCGYCDYAVEDDNVFKAAIDVKAHLQVKHTGQPRIYRMAGATLTVPS